MAKKFDNLSSQKELLCNSIKEMRRIKFIYNEKERLGEPQCYGVSGAGKDVLRVYLIKGGSRPEQLFEVAKMKNLQLLEDKFSRPGPNYSRNDTAMKSIYCQL